MLVVKTEGSLGKKKRVNRIQEGYKAAMLKKALVDALTPLRMEGTITFLVNGREEKVEVDPEKGPWRLELDGNLKLLRLDDHTEKTNSCVKCWKSYSSTEQEVMCRKVAKWNQVLRDKKGWKADMMAAVGRPQVQDFSSPSPSPNQPAQVEQAAEAEPVAEPQIDPAFREERIKEAKLARANAELRKPAVNWTSVSADQVAYLEQKVSPGIIYGLAFPFTENQLMEFGPQWLTMAFQASGVLDRDNQVTAVIKESAIKITSGNNCTKFFFEVKYAKKEPHLHTQLFAKVPYSLGPDTREDRLMCSASKQPNDLYEINACRLLEAKMPFKTPKFYYGDISNETSNFILIQERIDFAEIKGRRKSKGALESFEIEGPYEKCTDFQLRGTPREYYLLLMRLSGQIAGMYKAGQFGSREFLKAHVRFPPGGSLDPQAFGFNTKGVSGEAPQSYLSKLQAAQRFFGDTAKSLYPKYCNKQTFGKKMMETLMTYNAYAAEVEYFKHTDPDYVALGHMNLSPDNAYFWRDGGGTLDCGILDWGGFGVSNVGTKLYQIVNGSEFDTTVPSLDSYIDAFISAYTEFGGPKIDSKMLRRHIFLSMFSDLTELMGKIPSLLDMCSDREFRTVNNLHDPRVADNVNGKSTLRSSIVQMITGVRMLQEAEADLVLRDWVDNVYVAQFGQKAKEVPMS